MWTNRICVVDTAEALAYQLASPQFTVSEPQSAAPVATFKSRFVIVHQALSANTNCPQEIAHLIIDFQKYAPKRTHDTECRDLLFDALNHRPINDDGSHNLDYEKAMQPLRTVVESTQEMRVTGEFLEYNRYSEDRWRRVAAIVRDLPLISTLILNIPQSGMYYKYRRIDSHENQFYPATAHAVIDFLRAIELHELEHIEINAFMLAPHWFGHYNDEPQEKFFRDFEATLARTTHLTALTIVGERVAWEFPALQFPSTLRRIEVKDWRAPVSVRTAWAQAVAAADRVVIFTQTPEAPRAAAPEAGIDGMWGLNV